MNLAIYKTTSARALIRKKDSILVEWFAPKNISFLPGGTLEAGEDPKETLVRELAEEIDGAKFLIGRYLGRIGHIWKTEAGTDSCLNHFFEVTIDSENFTAKEPGRCIRWLQFGSPEFVTLQPPLLQKLVLNSSAGEWDFVEHKKKMPSSH